MKLKTKKTKKNGMLYLINTKEVREKLIKSGWNWWGDNEGTRKTAPLLSFCEPEMEKKEITLQFYPALFHEGDRLISFEEFKKLNNIK